MIVLGLMIKAQKVGMIVCLVTQLCLTFCSPMDCSPPDFSVRGILQARILEWAAVGTSPTTTQPEGGFSSVQFSCSVMSDSL